jgi:hypothetical protein
MVLHLIIVLWSLNSQRSLETRRVATCGGRGDLIAVAVCVADLATSLARTNPLYEDSTIRLTSAKKADRQLKKPIERSRVIIYYAS